MKKQILIAGMIMISAITFGQKKEIKSAEKATKSGDFTEAISILNQAENLISSADKTLKSQYYLAKGNAYVGAAGEEDLEKLKIAAESFSKAQEVDPKGKYVSELETAMDNLRVVLVNGAVSDRDSGDFKSASEKLYAGYQVSKKDTLYLYFAASNAVRAKDYDNALKYYQHLIDIEYTGITTTYSATNNETNVEKEFDTKDGRNKSIKDGLYSNPKDEKSESKIGEILKNMTLIYNTTGDTDKAAELIKKARKENPDNLALMYAEANMYYGAGDMVAYKAIISEIIERDPNNPELYFNFGVASKKNGETEAAIEYYEKALELDPNYEAALINIAQIILDKDPAMIEEMNALGTSTADYNRYDEIQEDRNNMYKEALPYLEKALTLSSDKVQLIRTLRDIYSQLSMDDKAKEMRARLEKLEGGN